ncbi:MAG: class F sortase [Propionibacteriaceae bacterium]|nr:class F sortase [Propionibacteriaceae bacterium]
MTAYDQDEYEDARVSRRNDRRRKSIVFPLIFITAVLLLVSAVGLWGYSQLVPPVENAKKDMGGNWVISEDVEPPEVIAEMAAVEELPGGKRFKVPSVGLDAPLGSVNVVRNVINPPGFYSVFWVKNMGVSLANAESGTVYMATHSLRNGGRGPGNYLIDINAGSAKVKIGAEMYADEVKYRVVDTISIPKEKISEAAIWDATVPGRIVVITCLQRPNNGRSQNNIVVIGELAD